MSEDSLKSSFYSGLIYANTSVSIVFTSLSLELFILKSDISAKVQSLTLTFLLELVPQSGCLVLVFQSVSVNAVKAQTIPSGVRH